MASLVGGGLSDELKQATFSIGLKGVQPDDVPKVEELITPTMCVRTRLSLRKRREIGERSEEQTLVVKLRRKKESG